jgi:UDP-4-amino-4,6-dideoxy-N-acetyl-beta-L-altrosamine transaminase
MIPYSRQSISRSDMSAVKRVLKSEYLTQGPAVPNFEEATANYCGSHYAVAVNSATSALHIACLALDLGPGDYVWTSPNSFVASANCALYCGAEIDFVDIDPNTYNMSTEKLEKKLQTAQIQGNLPKLLIPVHFAGQSCDMEKIYQLSLKYKFKIIEDASHAIGGMYKNNPIGNCSYSDITIFSFHPVKIITTGEGGMATTNDLEIYKKLLRLRSHGITREQSSMQPRPENEVWNYQQIEIGFNFRLNDIQAALGLNQLKRIDSFVSARRNIANTYNQLLKNLNLMRPWQDKDTRSSYHLYSIRVTENKYQKIVMNELYVNDISANLHYIPIHRQPYFENLGFKEGDFPEAEKYYRETVSLPIYPTLKKKEQRRVVEVLRACLK